MKHALERINHWHDCRRCGAFTNWPGLLCSACDAEPRGLHVVRYDLRAAKNAAVTPVKEYKK